MSPRRRRRYHRSLILCLTRGERAELKSIGDRLDAIGRIQASLRARRDFILSRVPDRAPIKSRPAVSKPPKQPQLL